MAPGAEKRKKQGQRREFFFSRFAIPTVPLLFFFALRAKYSHPASCSWEPALFPPRRPLGPPLFPLDGPPTPLVIPTIPTRTGADSGQAVGRLHAGTQRGEETSFLAGKVAGAARMGRAHGDRRVTPTQARPLAPPF